MSRQFHKIFTLLSRDCLRQFIGISHLTELTLGAGQWYDAVLTVNENGDFQASVFKVSDPAIRAEITENHNWGGLNWNSRVQVNTGTLDLDSYREEAPTFSYPVSGANSIRPHAATTTGNNSYTYDANGNMTQRTENGISYIQNFNADNKLESVTWPGHSVSFTYDGDGNRLTKTEDGVTTLYIGGVYEKIVAIDSAPMSAVATTFSSTNASSSAPNSSLQSLASTPIIKPLPTLTPYPTATPSPTPTATPPATPVPVTSPGLGDETKYYFLGGQRVAMNKGGVLYYFHADHLGSASLTTDSNGAIQHQIRYEPYGETRWEYGVDQSDYDFTGQRLDGFGLLDYNARYYDATLGRFISADTIVPDFANPQDLNRYGYVRNNPLASGDPNGHCPPSVDACRGAGGIPIDDYYRFGDRDLMASLVYGGVDPWYPVDMPHLQKNSFEPKGPMVEALKMVTTALKKPADVDLIGVNGSFLPPSTGPGQTGGIEAVRLRQKGHPFDKYLSSMQDSPANVQADEFRESKWAIYEYDGSAEGKGSGFSVNPYYGEGWNVSNLDDWNGRFDGYNLTVAFAEEGFSVSVFWNPPLDATKPFGYSVGPAGGLETSASHFSVFYRPILPR